MPKDTNDWVLPTATEIATDDRRERAIVHFDLKIESICAAMSRHAGDLRVAVVDGDTGAVLIDSRERQEKGGELGRPQDRTFAPLVADRDSAGVRMGSDRRAAFRLVDRRSPQSDNH